ncbi:hypothetical protein LDENG_00128100 [Lucifuga dentata]|nr:hypothetical protein LDENG_00128100 [Lucifuga dentata]
MTDVCVRVAVRIRPLLPKEVLHNHRVLVRIVPGSTQVSVGTDQLFSFDHAFGPTASQDEVYESCVQHLVKSLVDGCNATVFCYGQTGSGKTYTLGGRNLDEEGGIIDRVAQDVFLLLGEKRQNSPSMEVTVRVSYMELYKEELRDLLELHTNPKELHIRDDDRGNTVVVGAKEMVVTSAEELLSIVGMGNALRHTGTTGMNERSSRSHAILTLTLSQCCHQNMSSLNSVCPSKLCLVDLAGSERAGKTGNTGTRFKESVFINSDLLALSKVIRALSDPGQNGRGNNCTSAHIPYRDAKITRLLRDSLGGTAHTLMIACVSPSQDSVAETLSALQFAARARHIRNRPGEMHPHTELKTCPATWDPGKARLGELEQEIHMLRELLKEKNREMEMERGKTELEVGWQEDGSSQMRIEDPGSKMSQEEPLHYRFLVQEAADLLGDISGPTPSLSFRQRLQDWQERLTVANNHLHQTDDNNCLEENGDQPHHVTILQLRRELSKCQETLAVEKQVMVNQNAELRQVQNEVQKLHQESETHLQALQEEKERTRIQTEQLVDQQILIDRLRSDLMTFRGAKLGNSFRRPNSVPLIRHSCGQEPPRKIHSSPPAYSLERVMAAFKMRNHLLLAEIEEKDEVYRPFIKGQAKYTDRDQKEEEKEEEEDTRGRIGFRRSLNRTWTSRQNTPAQKQKNAGLDQKSDAVLFDQQHQKATGTKVHDAKQCQRRKMRVGSIVTQRRIQALSANIHMKEELIKELNKTDMVTQAVKRHGTYCSKSKEGDVLAKLSEQSQQARTELQQSLQQMRLQRIQLQTSLRQETETSDTIKKLDHNGELEAEDLTVWKTKLLKDSKEKGHDNSWLELEEERALQRRAELRELKEELRRREEVLQHREACLQQKTKLEMKRCHSSQVLSQDLLRMSVRLGSVEEQLESSSRKGQAGGVTTEELEKERDDLRKRRDTLEAQLKDNKVLTVEEEHSLLELDEAIEALDAAVELKNHSIHDKQKKLSVKDSSFSHSTEPDQLCKVTRKLKELSPSEAAELLIRYFNKVVCLREAEYYLQLYCKELELHAREQEVVLKEMEAVLQRLALDADHRLTQQHRDHQTNIQLLLQKLLEGRSGEAQQIIQVKLQHLEKELFFYKSSHRQLKKKLKEQHSDTQHAVNQAAHTETHTQPSHTQVYNMLLHANKLQTNTEQMQTNTHIVPTYTKIHSDQIDKKTHIDHAKLNQTQNSCPLLSSDLQAHKKTKMPTYTLHRHARSQGSNRRGTSQSGEDLQMTQVCLSRRELRQIFPEDLQVCGSATRRHQSPVDTSTEALLEDSIEVAKNSDG